MMLSLYCGHAVHACQARGVKRFALVIQKNTIKWKLHCNFSLFFKLHFAFLKDSLINRVPNEIGYSSDSHSVRDRAVSQ